MSKNIINIQIYIETNSSKIVQSTPAFLNS